MNGPFPKLGQIQAASGVAFSLFLLLHLVTTASAVFGIDAYNHTLETLRHIYRPHLAVELLLIGLSGGVHLGCAVWQFVRRRKVVNVGGPWWLRAHRLSGYFLLLVIVGHVLATRVAPTLATGPTATGSADFSFLAFAVQWAPWFFWPYYLLLGLCGALHLCFGLYLSGRILLPRRGTLPPGPSRLLTALSLALSMVVICGVLGILLRSNQVPTQRFPEYRALQVRIFR